MEQLCEYKNQTLEAFVVASRLSAKFDCPVAHQNCSFLATAHDCETELLSHNDYDKHLKRFKTLKQRMLATMLQNFLKKISFQIANMGKNANCTPDIHYQLG